MHCDAVQAAGRIPVDIKALGVDVLTLSAHKIGGPQGAGAIVRASEDWTFAPLLDRRRAGEARSAPAPRTSPPSPASARRPRRRSPTSTRRDGWAGWRDRLAAIVGAREATVFSAGVAAPAADAVLRRFPGFRRKPW